MSGELETTGRGLRITREQELEVIKSAFSLEKKVQTFFSESLDLQGNKPKEPKPPIEPSHEQATVDPIPYPAIDVSSTKFRWGKWLLLIVGAFFIIPLIFSLGFTVGIFGIVFFLAAIAYLPFVIVLAVKDSNKKKILTNQRINDVTNSPEYQRSCAEIDEQNRQRQAQLDKRLRDKYVHQNDEYQKATLKYNDDLKQYNEVVIPEWTMKITNANEALNSASISLKEVYKKNIIPVQYQDIDALEHINNTMSSSSYDLKTAIEMYDRYEQRQAEERRHQEIREAEEQAYYEQQNYYSQQDYASSSQSSSSGGILSGLVQSAAGAAIGTSGTRRELRKQTQMMEEQADRERARDRRAADDRYNERNRNNQMRSEIIRQNQERRRKGLPDLPVPPGDYRY